ncbi:MAG: type II toxin-antitoxin system RelE/ParE family toxin [Rhodopseudomonas sp.]|nr:type II toxin-antitoxin system RelE/ParE family toxin [Rhodopseudomonas sp.]
MISSFRDKITTAVAAGESPKGFPADLVKIARRKLGYLDAAHDLRDLRAPPGNHLEALSKDRQGQHSIRINDQFRICFRWTSQGPADVEITDYH